MSKFKEYLEMGKKGFKNLDNVTEGFFNSFLDTLNMLPPDQKAEANRRFNICIECPLVSTNAKKSGIYDTDRTDLHCSVCKCYISKKVMAFDEVCAISQLSNIQGYKPLWGKYKS